MSEIAKRLGYTNADNAKKRLANEKNITKEKKDQASLGKKTQSLNKQITVYLFQSKI